jgi:hypothetical protein
MIQRVGSRRPSSPDGTSGLARFDTRSYGARHACASYAAVTIFIALKVLLVVVLGVVEVAQGSYLGGDLPLPGCGERLLVYGPAALRLGSLVGISGEDR